MGYKELQLQSNYELLLLLPFIGTLEVNLHKQNIPANSALKIHLTWVLKERDQALIWNLKPKVWSLVTHGSPTLLGMIPEHQQ